ncbi:biliverdin-producing heme oxygenase [Qipengyuania sp. 1NDH17]|uniref:Biliverdin-producing heme oxygenase n=1 Tax=Qipengyuania polymorpha TaxID=2867234 RepID=A0ABS7IY18_9SPHN|nr:biliverdin-producing heme oxygenase [Qipengyuania polymorpha]MBX7458293.1 biliverdin-producing heme oxygenase [Qipengyuania polymorpha]
MRERLRQATGEIHARLDETVGHMPVSSENEYAAFLSAQFAARCAVERALAMQPPMGLAAPPSQAAALAQDLADLGVTPERMPHEFALDTPAAALGAAWVLAGSSLGNKAMLVQRGKTGSKGPERFLSDTGLARYFGGLLHVLDRPHSEADIAQAITGALATFALFEQAFAAVRLEKVA